MRTMPTVRLPVVLLDATIGHAISKLQSAGTSGVVVLDDRGQVVVTGRSLQNTLAASGGDRATLMSRVTARAFPTSGTKPFSWLGGESRTVLESAQDAYVVTDFDAESATVATDPQRAAELSQPFKFDGLDTAIA